MGYGVLYGDDARKNTAISMKYTDIVMIVSGGQYGMSGCFTI